MPAVALTDTGNLFAALEFSEAAAKAGDPADHRLPARARLRRRPPIPATAPPAPRPIVLLAQDETGFGNLMQLSSLNYLDCGAAAAARHARRARRPRRRPDLPDRRRRRPARRAASATATPPRARALAERLAALFPGRLYVEIQRHPRERRAAHPGRGGDRARPRRPRLRPRPAARRHQRRALPRPRDLLRRPRRADLHRRRRLRRPAGAAPPADARALLQVAGRDGRALRRPARGGREHRRDRPPLRLPPEEAQADPAALRRRRGRGAAPPGPRRPRRPPRGDPARPPRSRPTASGSSSSSASSRAWASPATS